jgi:hypothetical protein
MFSRILLLIACSFSLIAVHTDRTDVKTALSTGDYSQVHDFYQRTFSSPIEMNALLKRNPEQETAHATDPEINQELLFAIYDFLDDLVREYFFILEFDTKFIQYFVHSYKEPLTFYRLFSFAHFKILKIAVVHNKISVEGHRLKSFNSLQVCQ